MPLTQPDPNDYPVTHGLPVTERHVRICAERGHAQHIVDGVSTGECPRCGDATSTLSVLRMLSADELDALSNLTPYNAVGDSDWRVAVMAYRVDRFTVGIQPGTYIRTVEGNTVCGYAVESEAALDAYMASIEREYEASLA